MGSDRLPGRACPPEFASLSILVLLLFTEKAAGQFRFDSWTTDNGLPQASINSILQTRDGFLWFSSFGGLVRYDGLRFQVFNTGNTKGLKTRGFLDLFEDRDHDYLRERAKPELAVTS